MTTTGLPADEQTTSRAVEPNRSRSWRRSHAAAGLVFVGIEIACIAIQGGATPSRQSSATSIAAFFRDHARSVELSEVLAAFGLAALLWWFGGLWELLTSARPPMPALAAVAAGGFAIGLALGLVDISLFGTAGVAAHTVADDSLVLLYDASTAAILLSGIGIAGFLTATCLISSRSGLFPAWTNYLGLATSLALLFGAVGVGNAANTFLLGAYLAFVGWCVWTVAVSVSMWSRWPGAVRAES